MSLLALDVAARHASLDLHWRLVAVWAVLACSAWTWRALHPAFGVRWVQLGPDGWQCVRVAPASGEGQPGSRRLVERVACCRSFVVPAFGVWLELRAAHSRPRWLWLGARRQSPLAWRALRRRLNDLPRGTAPV